MTEFITQDEREEMVVLSSRLLFAKNRSHEVHTYVWHLGDVTLYRLTTNPQRLCYRRTKEIFNIRVKLPESAEPGQSVD